MARNLFRSQPTSSSEGVLTPKRSHRAWFSTTAVPSWFCTSTPPGKCRITSIKCAWAVANASSVSRRSVVSTRVQITSPSGCCGSRGVPLIENQRSAPVAVRMRYSTSTPPCSRTTSTYGRNCVNAASCRCRTLRLLPCRGSPSCEKVSTALWLASAMMRSGVEISRAAAALSSSACRRCVSCLRGVMSVWVPMTSPAISVSSGATCPRISIHRHVPCWVSRRVSMSKGSPRAIWRCSVVSTRWRSSGCTCSCHV